MGNMTIKLRMMPSSVESNLEAIKEKAESLIKENGGESVRFNEEPIAFGLKAIIAAFIYPEENDVEPLESQIREIEEVNSAEVVDMRRAIG